MFQTEKYLHDIKESMKEAFGPRLLYVGLQGSYMRGEAIEASDIDIMVVINDLTKKDLDVYREIILDLPVHEKSCGFICGMDELTGWNPLELCHLVHTTKDYYGNLSELLPEYSDQDIYHYIKVSLGNVYHELCHRYIHADRMKNYQALPFTYKGVFFILQNIYYLKTGVFCISKNEMLGMLEEGDKEIMEISMSIASEGEYDFDWAFEALFQWCQRMLSEFTLPENNESGRDRFFKE